MNVRAPLLIGLACLSISGCSALLSGAGLSEPIAESPIPALRATFGPTGPTEIALVISITDGDTIWVDIMGEESRVRYIGVDTPEVASEDRAAEPFAEEATTANAALVEDQIVVLETDVSETDDFGRLLRYVWLRPEDAADPEAGAWRLVNVELVRAGLADARDYPPDTKYSDFLEEAEQEARVAGLGIWAEE
jgi:micrococcal nuclease